MHIKYFEINRKLLPIKVHYFFWEAGKSLVQPNLSAYARQLGFSSVIVGFLFTAMPLISIVFRPLLGMMADKLRRKKELFIWSQVILLLSTVVIFYIPLLENRQPSVKVLCAPRQNKELQIFTEEDNINTCSLEKYKDNILIRSVKITYEKNFTINELIVSLVSKELMVKNDVLTIPIIEIVGEDRKDVWCNYTNETDYKLHSRDLLHYFFKRPKIDDEELITKYWCWLFFTAMVFYWISLGSVNSLGDTICFQLLGDKPNHYGRQRLFGALGWGIFSAISGIITDIISDGRATTNYSFCFYLSFILIFIDVAVCIKLEPTQSKISLNFSKDVCRFFLKLKNNIFFIWCTLIGLCSALIWQFLYWLIEDKLGKVDCNLQYYIKTLEGLVQFIETILGEIPLFFLSGWVLEKLGHINMMSLVLLCLGLRLIFYSVISNPWWFLPVELMNGIDFGLCFTCMVSYANLISVEGTEATVQSLVGAFYEGFGTCIGSSIAGISYKEVGGVQTFRYFGYLALVATVIHIVIHYILRYLENGTKCNNKADS